MIDASTIAVPTRQQSRPDAPVTSSHTGRLNWAESIVLANGFCRSGTCSRAAGSARRAVQPVVPGGTLRPRVDPDGSPGQQAEQEEVHHQDEQQGAQAAPVLRKGRQSPGDRPRSLLLAGQQGGPGTGSGPPPRQRPGSATPVRYSRRRRTYVDVRSGHRRAPARRHQHADHDERPG